MFIVMRLRGIEHPASRGRWDIHDSSPEIHTQRSVGIRLADFGLHHSLLVWDGEKTCANL